MTSQSLVPVSRRETAFARYKRSMVLPALIGQGGTMLALLPLALGGTLVAGPVGGVVGVAAWVAGAVRAFDRLVTVGNTPLRRDLAERLGPGAEAAEFVGMCRPENNELRPRLLCRVETDDNVGFLQIAGAELRITTEDGVVRIAREAIRSVDLTRSVLLPFMSLISIEVFDDAWNQHSLLVCSREGRRLSQHRKRTAALYARLVDWFTEPAVADV